jgi:hypothetical protein
VVGCFFFQRTYERAGNSCNFYRRIELRQFIRETEPEKLTAPGLIKEKHTKSS